MNVEIVLRFIGGILAGTSIFQILTSYGDLARFTTLEVWMVYVLAFALGVVMAVDNPTRRAFVPEMVGVEEIANAVGLNSTVFTSSMYDWRAFEVFSSLSASSW